MEYSFFHKNHFLFSTNCIRLTGGSVGIAGLKKVCGEMPGLSPASVPKKSKGSLSQSFPGFQQEVKAEIIHDTSLYDRGIWLSPHPAWWPWCAHTLFWGGRLEGVLLGVPLWIFQDFFQGSLAWRTARKIGKPSETFPCQLSGHPPADCRN